MIRTSTALLFLVTICILGTLTSVPAYAQTNTYFSATTESVNRERIKAQIQLLLQQVMLLQAQLAELRQSRGADVGTDTLNSVETEKIDLSNSEKKVYETLIERELSQGFAYNVSKSLPETIDDYDLLSTRSYYEKMADAWGKELDDEEVAELSDVPTLETYGCDKGWYSKDCVEQVWVSYENDARTTRVIFMNFPYDISANIEQWQSSLKTVRGEDYYTSKDTYVAWFPSEDFHLIMSRNTPSDDGLEPDISGRDSVTKYFLREFAPK